MNSRNEDRVWKKQALRTMMYVDMKGRHIHFGGTECEPPWKIVFQPEKRGLFDYEHKEFVKCLKWSRAQGYLNDTEMERRIRRGRPVTVSTKPIQPVEKKKITKATGNIDEIMANIAKLHKQIAPFKPFIEDDIRPEDIPKRAEAEVIESILQKEEEDYAKSINEEVFSQSVGVCEQVV